MISQGKGVRPVEGQLPCVAHAAFDRPTHNATACVLDAPAEWPCSIDAWGKPSAKWRHFAPGLEWGVVGEVGHLGELGWPPRVYGTRPLSERVNRRVRRSLASGYHREMLRDSHLCQRLTPPRSRPNWVCGGSRSAQKTMSDQIVVFHFPREIKVSNLEAPPLTEFLQLHPQEKSVLHSHTSPVVTHTRTHKHTNTHTHTHTFPSWGDAPRCHLWNHILNLGFFEDTCESGRALPDAKNHESKTQHNTKTWELTVDFFCNEQIIPCGAIVQTMSATSILVPRWCDKRNWPRFEQECKGKFEQK